jgi:hypothetical protein
VVKVVSKRDHLVNGRHYGWWVEFDTGVVMYVAYRKGAGSRGFHRNSNSWCVDVLTLNEAMRKNASVIGVIHDMSGKRCYYATLIRDMFGKFSEPHTMATTRQRRLPRQCWRVNPLTSEEYIAKSMRLR